MLKLLNTGQRKAQVSHQSTDAVCRCTGTVSDQIVHMSTHDDGSTYFFFDIMICNHNFKLTGAEGFRYEICLDLAEEHSCMKLLKLVSEF